MSMSHPGHIRSTAVNDRYLTILWTHLLSIVKKGSLPFSWLVNKSNSTGMLMLLFSAVSIIKLIKLCDWFCGIFFSLH